jgi:hypothetical protein
VSQGFVLSVLSVILCTVAINWRVNTLDLSAST